MNPDIIARNRESVALTNWRLLLTIPSVLAEGETFSMRMTAFAPDGMPSGNFDRDIAFDSSPGIEGLPSSVRFSPASNGFMTIEGLRVVRPDYAFAVARPANSPMPLFSNPARVFADPPYRVFWGDLHVHTTFSNCSPWACKDPEFCFAFARHAAHLDFCAAADHLRGIASDETRWPELQRLVRDCCSPGHFIPFLGFESSHATGFGGDNNAYFRDADGPYFWLDREDMGTNKPRVTLRELWDFLDASKQPYFTVPHHTGRTGKYRSFADPDYDARREPLFEIYSGWGSSEQRTTRFPLAMGNTDEPAYFSDALLAGCRYGTIASSDDHTTTPGGESRNWTRALGDKGLPGYPNQGLTAVKAKALTREAIWDGLVSRQTCATTLARTLLDFRIGDASMGEAIIVAARDPLREKRQLCVDVCPSGFSTVKITLVRNGTDLMARNWRRMDRHVIFEDQESLEQIAVRDALHHPEPFVVYYVRVEDPQHQTQWSSPIWLDL